MDIYYKKRRWKQAIFVFAILIGIGSLLYTNNLVKQTSHEERLKMERWAQAISIITKNETLDGDLSNLLSDITSSNTTIPIIIVEKDGTFNTANNIKYNEKNKEKVIARELAKMKARQKPIVNPLGEGDNQYLYYKESSLLVKLKFYPIFQLGVIMLFIIVAYLAFSSSRKAEQNLVWIGMAKETAHQLGTPISSLIAWVELLKEENIKPEIIDELGKDTERLGKITERFSKVGSVPELYPENLYLQLYNSISYLMSRVSKKIEFRYNFDKAKELYIPLSASLFSWVIENLIRNAVDAIEDKQGLIEFFVEEREKEVYIDITDNGKGIPKSKFKAIFNPGFTTKKRGWGLGLSLSKRIIDIYHNGKIFIKNSELKKGTTFRIVLKK